MPLPSEHDVLALDELPEGEMRQVVLDGTPVLLVREGSAVHAVSATCPHAGGPLIQGVRHGHRIVCPWHKAAFCLRTGAVLEPPALDPLLHYDTRIEGGRVKLAMPRPVAPARPAADSRCFVIIGAGAAGAVAAQTLREIGFAGQIIMLDRANRVPYDRTVLSKYHLSGETGGEKTPLQRQSYWREHGIERRTAEVVQVDALARRITCADGTMLPYDAALLATGGEPHDQTCPVQTLTMYSCCAAERMPTQSSLGPNVAHTPLSSAPASSVWRSRRLCANAVSMSACSPSRRRHSPGNSARGSAPPCFRCTSAVMSTSTWAARLLPSRATPCG